MLTAKYINSLQRSFILRLKSQSLKALLFEKGSKIIKFIPFLGLKPNSWGLSLELLFNLMREKANFFPFPHFLLRFSVDQPTQGCNLSSYSVSFPDFFYVFSLEPDFLDLMRKKGILIFLSGSPLPSPQKPLWSPCSGRHTLCQSNALVLCIQNSQQ